MLETVQSRKQENESAEVSRKIPSRTLVARPVYIDEENKNLMTRKKKTEDDKMQTSCSSAESKKTEKVLRDMLNEERKQGSDYSLIRYG